MRRTLGALVLAATLTACGGGGDAADTPAELVAEGERLYHGEATCATCHGDDLRGTAMGPPFLHEVYEPGHHPNASFHAAVKDGVQPHHWDFGPMPPLDHLDDDEIDAIVAYVRTEQQRAGIG